MAELRIHQEQLDETASASSLTYVPLVPSAAGMERWKLTLAAECAGCV